MPKTMRPDGKAGTFSKSDITRQQLIQAAVQVFADQYYDAARVSDIAKIAGCPISTINYHFGSKSGLYQAMISQLLGEHVARWPLIPEHLADAPAPVRFRSAVHALVHRFIAPGAQAPITRILARELAQPTDAVNVLIDQVARPHMRQVHVLISELTGETDPRRLQQITLSIVGQCTIYFFGRPIISQTFPEAYTTDLGAELIAEHVTRFSFAAMGLDPALPFASTGDESCPMSHA